MVCFNSILCSLLYIVQCLRITLTIKQYLPFHCVCVHWQTILFYYIINICTHENYEKRKNDKYNNCTCVWWIQWNDANAKGRPFPWIALSNCILCVRSIDCACISVGMLGTDNCITSLELLWNCLYLPLCFCLFRWNCLPSRIISVMNVLHEQHVPILWSKVRCCCQFCMSQHDEM